MTIFYSLPYLQSVAIKYRIPVLRGLSLISGRIKPKLKQESLLIENHKKVPNKANFLLHPERVLADTKTLDDYKLQYLILTAYRDYNLYYTYGTKRLPLSFFPDLDIGKIRHNPLLEITNDNHIKFKYEE